MDPADDPFADVVDDFAPKNDNDRNAQIWKVANQSTAQIVVTDSSKAPADFNQIKILKRPSRSSDDQLNVTASLSQKDLHKARAAKEKEYERAKKRIFGTSEADASTSTSQTSEFPSASSSTRVGSTSTDKKKVINHKSSTRRSPVANPESPSQNKSNQFTLKSERPSRSKSNTSNQDTPGPSLAAFPQSPAKTQSDQVSISKTTSKNAGS